MEAIIFFAVVVAVLLVLGVSGFEIMRFFMIMLALALLGTAVFFAFSAAKLILSKRCKGEFVRFEKKQRFEVAIYRIDGQEFANIFPAEPIMRRIIYRPGVRTLHLYRRSGKEEESRVFDSHTILIIVAGLLLSALSLLIMAFTVKLVGLV